jgi:hypothetical protein
MVGEPPPYPRDLRAVLCWLPELHVVEIPQLTVQSALACAQRFGFQTPAMLDNRPLAGCFVGQGDQQLILVDPLLEPAELRLTLAHEVAHFLRDFDEPRRRAIARWGPAIRDVLDGRRSPTPEERIAGLLAEVPICGYHHFLDRDHWGRAIAEDADDAENAADSLAYELLAPFDELPPQALFSRRGLAAFLVAHRGLPRTIANQYAAEIIY